jgi:hypothetical protein
VIPVKAIGKVLETRLTTFTPGRDAKLRRLLNLSAEGVSRGVGNAKCFVRGGGVFTSILVPLALILLSVVGAMPAAYAQAQTAGEITGQVLDPSKAAISNAAVRATNSATGAYAASDSGSAATSKKHRHCHEVEFGRSQCVLHGFREAGPSIRSRQLRIRGPSTNQRDFISFLSLTQGALLA